MSAPRALPDGLAGSLTHQPAARVGVAAALADPAHAYLFEGPRGSGKREAARAFAAELLAAGSDDPGSARRRVLADPSPHPDLAWLRPPGTQHLVDEVRERVIRAAAFRPFEADRRVFVIEQAELLREESQNALLKTLEEPAGFAHFMLVSSEPGVLLETIVSRCQPIRFVAVPADAIEQRLRRPADIDAPPGAGDASGADGAGAPSPDELAAVARLARGDLERARMLASADGRRVRAVAERCVAAARAGRPADAPIAELLAVASDHGEARAVEVGEALAHLAESLPERSRERRRAEREAADQVKRTQRRARTDALDLSLELIALWCRDLSAVAAGAPEQVLATDRTEQLRAQAAGLAPGAAERGVERATVTRRRLATLNVGEALALEALLFELTESIGP